MLGFTIDFKRFASKKAAFLLFSSSLLRIIFFETQIVLSDKFLTSVAVPFFFKYFICLNN